MQAVSLLRAESDRHVLAAGGAAVIVVVTAAILGALSPLALKALVDAIAAPRPAGAVSPWPAALASGSGYLLLLAATRVLADVRPLLTGRIHQRLHVRLAQRFFDHVLRLPMSTLLTHRGGEMQHRLDLASAGVQLMIGHLVCSLLPVLVELATMAGVMIHLRQPALVAVFGTAALAYVAIFAIGARRMARTAHEVSAASLEMYARLGEGLAHLETLRCFHAEDQARGGLSAACAGLERHCAKLDRLNVGIGLAASATFAASITACLVVGLDAIGIGTMSVGGFVLTLAYALQMVQPLESLGTAARDLSRALGYFEPLLALLAEPVTSESGEGRPESSTNTRSASVAATVRFENLHFAYASDQPVLRGVDFDVPAGSMTAIVGRSGSGKSSLVRLLMRLYAPQQGRILLDGRALESIAAAELRGTLIGLVPQETALLHGTIAENIALGTPAAGHDAMRLAARRAQLADLVDALPLGLDTPVGEHGMCLSGGERQRVGIARALLRRPGLYVLDEPTSMLDGHTEQAIRSTLRSLSGAATTIVIAHRLSTVVDADQIVVLDEGRVRERGSHAELLAGNGLYAEMWRQQMAGTT